MEITPEQIRAARALLRMEQAELARRAQVPVVTVCRMEAAGDGPRSSQTTRDGVRQALEQAGAEFMEGGVRRRVVRPDATARFQALRAISQRSAERLAGHVPFNDADLHDEDGLPR